MSRILDLHGIRRVSMVAHSYGSFYVSCMLKLAPERVHAVCLLDPVCCCMWSGHLITSFVYNPARSTTGLITWLIARDIHTATTVSRNFFWTDVNLWPDEVPQHAVVALSGKVLRNESINCFKTAFVMRACTACCVAARAPSTPDFPYRRRPTNSNAAQDDLVPVRQVYTMLREETSARILYHPGMVHADFLFSPSWQNRVLCEMAEVRGVALPRAASRTRPLPRRHSSLCCTCTTHARGAACVRCRCCQCVLTAGADAIWQPEQQRAAEPGAQQRRQRLRHSKRHAVGRRCQPGQAV